MNSKINSMVQTIQYCSLFIHNISNFVLTSSLRVDVLQFDNDVDNKLFTFHEFTIRSLIHVLILLSNQSLMYIYPTPLGWVSRK